MSIDVDSLLINEWVVTKGNIHDSSVALEGDTETEGAKMSSVPEDVVPSIFTVQVLLL